MDTPREITPPQSSPETAPYWMAAREGRLLVKRCEACGERHAYPRALCPFCFSEDTVWEEASGRGTVYSFSIMRRAKPPYAVAYVTLEEGPTIISNIVDAEFDALRIGQPVTLTFRDATDGQPVPMFRPAGEGLRA
ncbi:Zn-ribbon domain-containing OB-fold protein [Muricoccus vinaceus]|uniref:Zn-ribbon domain-containing OB-fold protein n=1 Tax=Muricoccus vinaceus TaxID=424704 RepID=A0ABV6IRR9_9PROT